MEPQDIEPIKQPVERSGERELEVISQVETEELKPADALDRIKDLPELVRQQHDALLAQRSSHKLEFDQARHWLGKLDGLELQLVKINMDLAALNRTLKNLPDDKFVPANIMQELYQLEAARAELLTTLESLEQETAQHRGVETEASDEYPMEAAGAMKTNWRGSDEFTQGKLGKFGQDVMLLDRSKRIGVVADGTSGLKESYEVSRRVAQGAEQALQQVDQENFTLEEIQFFVEGELQNIVGDLDVLDPESNGSCAILAARYLEKFDAVMVIDLGDCEGVLRIGDDTIPVKRRIPKSTTLEYRFEKQAGKPAELQNPGLLPVVHVVSLAEFRAQHPNTPIHLLLGTDGLKNNSGKSLQEQAGHVVASGVRAIVEQFQQRKDDITIIDMDLTERYGQPVQQQPEVASAAG